MRDIHSGIAVISAIGAALLTADATSAAIDLQGFDSAEIVLAIGIGGITFDAANKIEFKLTESDDDLTYTAITDDDVLGVRNTSNGIIKALTSAHAAASVHRFGYIGGKRYLKIAADFSGTHGTGTPIAAMVLQGKPSRQPVADQA
jgi:hypothetical protein